MPKPPREPGSSRGPGGAGSADSRLSRRQVLVGGATVAAGVAGLLHAAGPVDPGLGDLVTRCRFGAYAHDEPWPVDAHFALESELGTRLPVSSWFQEFGGSWPSRQAGVLAARGKYDIVVCWELHRTALADVIAGRYDQHIRDYVSAAGSYPGEVVLRPLHEANGDWYDWAPAAGRGYITQGSAQLRQAWRHLVTVARSTGHANVKFFWCMNAVDVGGVSLESLWPGSDVVDYVGVDAYKSDGPGDFDTVLSEAYRRVTALADGHEFWVGETAAQSARVPDPAGYYRSVYTSRSFPRLTTVLWFHAGAWRITAAAAAVRVHREQLPRMPQYGGMVKTGGIAGGVATRAARQLPTGIRGNQ